MNIRTSLSTLAALLVLGGCAATPPQGAQSVAIVEPMDGATVSSPFKVRFAVNGMQVRPAGEVVADTGHHHLLINQESMKSGETIPVDAVHLHFGKGQTETMVSLPPGKYRLTAQFANGIHQSYGDSMSATISVTVQ